MRIWTDNDGGLGALKAGSAKAIDHNRLVHAVWLLAAKHDIGLFIDRVSSHDSVSDFPSRGSYELLAALRAEWREPELPVELRPILKSVG